MYSVSLDLQKTIVKIWDNLPILQVKELKLDDLKK